MRLTPTAYRRRVEARSSTISAWPGPGLFGGRRDRRRGGGRRLGGFVLLAVRHHVARAAFGFRLPLLFEFLDELAQRRLLLRGRQLRFDRGFGLLQRLLAAGMDRRHLEDVIAEGCLHRSAQDVLLSREDRCVERLLLLAFDHARERAAGGLARGIYGHALCNAREALARFDFLLGLLGLRFGLREDDQQVTFFRRAEALRIFVVVLGDLRLGDLGLLFDDLLLDFRREQVQLHTQQQVRDRLAGVRKELFEFRRLRELLALDFF